MNLRCHLLRAACLAGLCVAMALTGGHQAAAAQITLAAPSLTWRPATDSSPTLLLSVASDTASDVLADRLTSWQLGLRLIPQAGASGTLGFGVPSLPAGYLLAGHSLGLFQGASPPNQLLVTDAASGGNAGAVQIPALPTPLLSVGLTEQGARGVFSLVAIPGDTFWTGRESLDPAERNFFNVPRQGPAVVLATITIEAMLTGDANGDCTVGAADYALWAAQFGQTATGLSADFDAGGSVGAGDYALWAANFGKSCSPATAAAVPEPGGLVLMALGLVAVGVCRRSGHRPLL